MNLPLDSAAIPSVAACADTAPSPEALAMIDRLLAVPTVSRDSNLGVIEIARDHLAALGLAPSLVYDRRERKANLFCTLA
ncbi:MAG: acetylornithine deacetylase, partial [Betaproteobacteria bacterium]